MHKRFSAMFGATISIGLSKTGIAVLRTGGGWRKETSILADHPLTENATLAPERLTLQCNTILADAACAGLPLTVTLGDEWVRLFMVTPPQNTGRLQDIHAAAAMRFQALYGETSNDWFLEADWDACKPFLACALPRTLLGTLQQVVQESRLHLLSVMPQFVVSWNNWYRNLHAGAWFGVVQENILTLGAIAQTPQQRLCAVHAIPIPSDGHDLSWMQEQVTRAALRLNLPMPSKLQLVGIQHQYWVTSGTSTVGDTLAVSNVERSYQTANGAAPPHSSLSAAVLLARSGMRA